ncbi:MAG: diguanylate cyclase domain-containing protein [Acidiferrobacterales bacterium]
MNPSDIPAANGARPTVLLVDDSRVMRKAIGKILGVEFNLIEAEDGEAGWQQLTSHPEIEVVISDIEMPKLDGYEFMTRIRNFEDIRIRAMPVIVITGAEDEETRQTALDMGATDFIIKPVDRTQLLARTRAQAKYTETTRDLEETTISLKSETTQDPLTRLSSRRFFLQRGEQDIAYCTRHNQDLALLRVDIDKFRRLYAEYGDETVDEVLIWIAHTLAQTARTEDTLARIGGSSFALMAPSTNPGEAMILGDRLRSAISKRPYTKDNLIIPMTASVGLAMLTNHPGNDIESLLSKANENLREARRGGGKVVQAEDKASADLLPSIKEIEKTAALLGNDNLAQAETAIGSIDFSESEELVLGGDIDLLDEVPAPQLDKAMASLDPGVLSELEPHLWSLLARLLPMLEYCDEKLNLGIGAATKVIRHKIENPEEE